ncbi:uncharacterized protein LOC8277324 isoform X1 [Ricinus communis]|uniref:uncharacterized protein LOC8277324 isoform X1 n=1 Tax=Ricinus communis TaxID=3988 RepID=UPI000D69D3F9|nr:uncharacterized protein LOC8277324 isoform X1 [Ricinus communis]|eukprot:XP_025014350.1 uncharacterized protein LOC8277324 isoform X1 [Ricinus communis]
METEDMISLPDSTNSGDGIENNELDQPESGPGEAESQPSNYEAEEGMIDGHNMGLNEVDIGNKTETSDPEKLELNQNDFGAEECTKGSKDSELNEENVKTEECSAVQENLGENLVDAVTEEDTIDRDYLFLNQGVVREEGAQCLVETDVDMDLVDSPVMQVNIEVAEAVAVSGNLSSFGFRLNAQNSCLDTQNESLIQNHMMKGGHVSGVKRARIAYNEQQPSVHVTYNSLTRASKRKLEELLQQWSEWHVQRGSSSQDLNEVLESGEETYFPALCVGTEKSSAVSFWIENQTKKQLNNDLISSDSDSVPLYDRGFAIGLTSTDGPSNVEGGLEIVNEAARCFNCGSYSHALKECPKPRNNAAVNNARKQHKSKRNQNAGSRNGTRYYQSSSGGKYEGLKPGSLDAETRRLLGLGELDPPPWLNRMRELGYPPGYLDPDDEDQPSGIIIFADGDIKDEQEDGEIIETENPDPPRKMAVEFPGINAPIPENADERLWETGPSSYNSFRNRPFRKSDHSSETISRWHHHEQRGSRDSIDEGPPGVDPVFSPSSFPPRYGNYDSSYSSDSLRGSTASLPRSRSEKGRRSPVVYEDFASHSSSPFSSLNKRSSPKDNDSDRLESETDERWNYSRLDYSYRSIDEHDRYEYDRHRHRSRRS